ncbi:MAG: hypothetical protein SGI92_31495 [Bryobacteraceae bacterium]|nr:hypothetical protein [Bryobacteraceae bacterium]
MSRACFETPNDGLADIIQGLGLRASLGDAARNGRALRNKHAGLVELQRHEHFIPGFYCTLLPTMESHTSAARRSFGWQRVCRPRLRCDRAVTSAFRGGVSEHPEYQPY